MTKLPFEKFLCAPQESFLLLSFYGGLLAISRFGEGETEKKISVRDNLKDWQGPEFKPAYWKGRMEVLKMGCGGDL